MWFILVKFIGIINPKTELKEEVKAYMYKYNFRRFHSAIGYQKPINMYLEFIKM